MSGTGVRLSISSSYRKIFPKVKEDGSVGKVLTFQEQGVQIHKTTLKPDLEAGFCNLHGRRQRHKIAWKFTGQLYGIYSY